MMVEHDTMDFHQPFYMDSSPLRTTVHNYSKLSIDGNYFDE